MLHDVYTTMILLSSMGCDGSSPGESGAAGVAVRLEVKLGRDLPWPSTERMSETE